MKIKDVTNTLVRQAAPGGVEAFGEIYRNYSGFIYTLVFRILNNHDDALEVSQEVFIKMFKELRNFKFESSLKTWAYRIAVNTALNARKKIIGSSGRHVTIDETRETSPALRDSAAEQALKNTDNETTVSGLLDALTPDQRACIVLREMEGFSYEEIAKTLSVNINTVRSRLKRARETLIARGKDI